MPVFEGHAANGGAGFGRPCAGGCWCAGVRPRSISALLKKHGSVHGLSESDGIFEIRIRGNGGVQFLAGQVVFFVVVEPAGNLEMGPRARILGQGGHALLISFLDAPAILNFSDLLGPNGNLPRSRADGCSLSTAIGDVALNRAAILGANRSGAGQKRSAKETEQQTGQEVA